MKSGKWICHEDCWATSLKSIGDYPGRKVEDHRKVILLDLKLPKVDGLEVLDKLKTDNRTKKLPVVILTSTQDERDLIESYRLGVNSYIVKPVEFNKFIDSVSDIGLYWLLLNKLPNF